MTMNLSSLESLKIFVKESGTNLSDKTKEIKDTDKFLKTNISGDEAKKIYDDIINDISEKKNINIPSIKPEKKIISITNNDNNSSNSIKLNQNKILKAVEQGDIDYLNKYLNKSNVNKIFDNYGWSPLMSAACCGNEFIVKFLLELDANKQYKNKYGLTALQLAKKNNFKDVIKLLENDYLTKNKNLKTDNYGKINSLKIFYCEICKKNYKETNLKEHQASIVHNLNKNLELPLQPPIPFYGLSIHNKGYKIMLNNGWNDRNGLGPYGSGLKYPVKTILKRDRRGLGEKPYEKPKITHFKSNDINAVIDVKEKNIASLNVKALSKKDRKNIIDKDRRKERELRRALS